jgi:endonuclease YncB( thermonuclease family)
MCSRFAPLRALGGTVLLLLVPAIAIQFLSFEPGQAGTGTLSAGIGQCGNGKRITCVVDGDTIWLSGTKIRMADYNTPEMGEPACRREAELGRRATHRLIELLNTGTVTVRLTGQTDKYGRSLALIERDGRSVGDILVAEGLARWWNGGLSSRDWCS